MGGLGPAVLTLQARGVHAPRSEVVMYLASKEGKLLTYMHIYADVTR